MAALDVVQGNLAGVLAYLFGQEVGGVAFCNSRSPLYFSLDRIERIELVDQVVLPFTVFSPRLVSSWLMLLMECPSMNSWWIRRTVGSWDSSTTRSPSTSILYPRMDRQKAHMREPKQ